MSARALSSLTWATRLARPQRGRLTASILLGTVAVLAAMGLLATSGYLISKAALAPPILTLGIAIVGVRFFGITRAIARYLERLVSHDAALRILAGFRVTLYRRLVPLIPGGLGRTRTGDLLSRFVADVDQLQHLFVRALGPPAIALLAILVAVGVAAAMAPAAGLAMAVGLGVSAALLPLLAGRLGRSSGRRQAPARATLTTELVEAIEGAPELALYGRAGERLERITRADDELTAIARADARTAGLASGLGLAATGATVALVLFAAIPSLGGRQDGVLIAALALLALAAFEAILPLPVATQHLTATASAAGRLREITERPVPVPDPPAPAELPEHGALCAEDITVVYPGEDRPVLDGATLSLRQGERLALVGASGSGKSTLALALTRLVPLTGGSLRLGETDLTTVAGDAVRRQVRLEAGDGHLFATSIRENVRLARPEATDTEVDEVLGRAGLAAWLATLPDGPDTHVGEAGALISGGQRQRVLLARMLLADARFLILDEPAAHMDAEGARALMEDVLRSLPPHIGVLVITHRTEGLEWFDRVAVMRRGRIVSCAPPTATGS